MQTDGLEQAQHGKGDERVGAAIRDEWKGKPRYRQQPDVHADMQPNFGHQQHHERHRIDGREVIRRETHDALDPCEDKPEDRENQ